MHVAAVFLVVERRGAVLRAAVVPEHRVARAPAVPIDEFRTETGGEILIVQYPGPTTGGRPVYEDRFNLQERRPVAAERIDR